jgi:hypothetical protein
MARWLDQCETDGPPESAPDRNGNCTVPGPDGFAIYFRKYSLPEGTGHRLILAIDRPRQPLSGT